MLHMAIKQFMQTHNNIDVAFFCSAYLAELQCIATICDMSKLPLWQHQHCRGVVIAIVQWWVPSDRSKSMDPDES